MKSKYEDLNLVGVFLIWLYCNDYAFFRMFDFRFKEFCSTMNKKADGGADVEN